jgi:hypothetical protein
VQSWEQSILDTPTPGPGFGLSEILPLCTAATLPALSSDLAKSLAQNMMLEAVLSCHASILKSGLARGALFSNTIQPQH